MKRLPIGTMVKWKTYPYPIGRITLIDYYNPKFPYYVEWQDQDGKHDGIHKKENFWVISEPNEIMKKIL